MRRLVWLVLALIAVLGAIMLLRPGPNPGAHHAATGADVSQPQAAVTVPSAPQATTAAATTVSEPQPIAAMQPPQPTAEVPGAGAATAAILRAAPDPAPSPGRITGRIAAPTLGKPVAPVDIAWDVDDRGERRRAVITITNRSGEAAALNVTVTPGRLRLDGPASSSRADVAPGADLVLDTSIVLDDGRQGGSLIVQITHTAMGMRSRVVTIDIPGSEPRPAEASPPTADGSPLHGVQRVVGPDGRRILFMPAAAPATAAGRP